MRDRWRRHRLPPWPVSSCSQTGDARDAVSSSWDLGHGRYLTVTPAMPAAAGRRPRAHRAWSRAGWRPHRARRPPGAGRPSTRSAATIAESSTPSSPARCTARSTSARKAWGICTSTWPSRGIETHPGAVGVHPSDHLSERQAWQGAVGSATHRLDDCGEQRRRGQRVRGVGDDDHLGSGAAPRPSRLGRRRPGSNPRRPPDRRRAGPAVSGCLPSGTAAGSGTTQTTPSQPSGWRPGCVRGG